MGSEKCDQCYYFSFLQLVLLTAGTKTVIFTGQLQSHEQVTEDLQIIANYFSKKQLQIS